MPLLKHEPYFVTEKCEHDYPSHSECFALDIGRGSIWQCDRCKVIFVREFAVWDPLGEAGMFWIGLAT
jgi:hypothetical protein